MQEPPPYRATLTGVLCRDHFYHVNENLGILYDAIDGTLLAHGNYQQVSLRYEKLLKLPLGNDLILLKLPVSSLLVRSDILEAVNNSINIDGYVQKLPKILSNIANLI